MTKKKLSIEIDADHATMYAEYTQLRTEVQNAGSILRCVTQISKDASWARSRYTKKDMEL